MHTTPSLLLGRYSCGDPSPQATSAETRRRDDARHRAHGVRRTSRVATSRVAASRVSACFALLSLVACAADGGGSAGPPATVDTLAGGVVRTVSSAPAEPGRWRLEPVLRIQPPEGSPGELFEPGDLAITTDGGVLVAESREAAVKVFDAEGTYVRTIGRDGAGPGEFRSAWLAVRGDTLLVQDPQLARASTFLISDGTLLATHATAGRYWAPVGIDGRHRAVIRMVDDESADSSMGPAQRFLRLAFRGTPLDTVAVPYRASDGEAAVWRVQSGDRLLGTVRVPLVARDEQQADPAGGFVTAWTGAYVLRVSRDGRDTAELFGRLFEPEPVSSGDKVTIARARARELDFGPSGPPPEALERAFTVDKIPDVRPPFEQFHLDPAGRTWVRRTLADSSFVTFDVFGADRRWLDVVQVPAAGWPGTTWASVAWGKDRVAVLLTDDAGLPLVQLYRIVRR